MENISRSVGYQATNRNQVINNARNKKQQQQRTNKTNIWDFEESKSQGVRNFKLRGKERHAEPSFKERRQSEINPQVQRRKDKGRRLKTEGASCESEEDAVHPLLMSTMVRGMRHIQIPVLRKQDSFDALIDEMFPHLEIRG